MLSPTQNKFKYFGKPETNHGASAVYWEVRRLMWINRVGREKELSLGNAT